VIGAMPSASVQNGYKRESRILARHAKRIAKISAYGIKQSIMSVLRASCFTSVEFPKRLLRHRNERLRGSYPRQYCPPRASRGERKFFVEMFIQLFFVGTFRAAAKLQTSCTSF